MMWLTVFWSVPLGLRGATTPWQLERAMRRMEAPRPARGIVLRLVIPRLGSKTPPLKHRVLESLLSQMFPPRVVLPSGEPCLGKRSFHWGNMYYLMTNVVSAPGWKTVRYGWIG